MKINLKLNYYLTLKEMEKIKYLLQQENKEVTAPNIKKYLLKLFEYYVLNQPDVLEYAPNKSISSLFEYILEIEYEGLLYNEVMTSEENTIME